MQARANAAETESREGRGAFAGFIGPKTLVAEVANAAPFLFDGTPEPRPGRLSELRRGPLGWLSILRGAERLGASAEPTPAARTDYFALCLAAHFASVATYVPTDVDSKIRGALWSDQQDPGELERMRDLALELRDWDLRGVSARFVDVEGVGPVSGHDGERLSVWCGGMLATEDGRFEAGIDAELAREARAFDLVAREPGRELDLLRLAAVLTHNAGDVGQGLGGRTDRTRFAGLARERFDRYGGAFGRAAAIYRAVMASEGHRNYPLRATKLLRAHPDLLLPIGPFLDDWGARLATWPAWGTAERAEVLSAIVTGCRKVAGQESYFRALAGFEGAHRGGLDASEVLAHCGSAVRRELKDPTLRRKVAVPRVSFEKSLAKRARTALDEFRA